MFNKDFNNNHQVTFLFGGNMEKTKKELLDDKLWMTKKSRMNAEKRLISNANFFNIANIYYSVFIAIISIISIVTDNTVYSLVSVILSVTLTITISFSSSLNYKERAEKMKKNYIDINKLEIQLKYTNENDELKKIELEYNNLLNNVENHIEFDYFKAKINNNEKLNKKQIFSYCCHLIFVFLFRAIIFIIPVFVVTLTKLI